MENKKLTEKEILEQLKDPNLSDEEKDKLMELLYEGIDIKKEGWTKITLFIFLSCFD